MSGCLNLSFTDNINIFNQKLKEILAIPDIPEEKNINNINHKMKMANSEVLSEKILKEFNEIKNNSIIKEKLKELESNKFEKNIPELGHIQFIHMKI